MIYQGVQRLEDQSNVIGHDRNEMPQSSDSVLEFDTIGDFFETVCDAPVRIQCVRQERECPATRRASSGHSIRHIGEENGMRFLGGGTSRAMAAEIDDLDIMVPASCLDGGNVLVSPTPEFDMPKTSRGNAWNFLFCEQAGIQGVKANGG